MKTLLMVNHTAPGEFQGELDFPDVREVEAFVVGGLDGVFAIYKIDKEPDIYYFASGDDGDWWRIDNGLHGDWLNGVYLILAETMIDRVGKLGGLE